MDFYEPIGTSTSPNGPPWPLKAPYKLLLASQGPQAKKTSGLLAYLLGSLEIALKRQST